MKELVSLLLAEPMVIPAPAFKVVKWGNTDKGIYYEELAHGIMEAQRSCALPSANRRMMKTRSRRMDRANPCLWAGDEMRWDGPGQALSQNKRLISSPFTLCSIQELMGCMIPNHTGGGVGWMALLHWGSGTNFSWKHPGRYTQKQSLASGPQSQSNWHMNTATLTSQSSSCHVSSCVSEAPRESCQETSARPHLQECSALVPRMQHGLSTGQYFQEISIHVAS